MATMTTRIRELVLCALIAASAASSYNNDNSNPQQWSSSYYPDAAAAAEQRGPPPPDDPASAASTWYQDDQAPPAQQQPPPQYGRPDTGTFTPINYQFQSKQPEDPRKAGRGPRRGDPAAALGDDGVPITSSVNAPKTDFDPDAPKTETPRQDAVTRYMSTLKGRVALRSSTALVGTALGGFIFKSLLNTPTTGGLATGFLLVFLTFFRSPFGELARALGLTLIFVWQRTFRIRRRYPTWPHIKSSLGAGPRMAFPREDDFQSGQIRYVYTLIAMGFVGSACGGNLPLVPTWLGALGGAGLLVILSTLRSSRGDLARSMGMRVVAVVEELLDINTELKVVQKSGVVAGKILDKVLIMDRKHRIKDRIAAGLTFAYEQVSRTAGQINDGGGKDNDSERRRDERDDDRRRANRGRDDKDSGRRRDDRDGDRRRDDRDGDRLRDDRDGDRRRDDRDGDRRRDDKDLDRDDTNSEKRGGFFSRRQGDKKKDTPDESRRSDRRSSDRGIRGDDYDLPRDRDPLDRDDNDDDRRRGR